jgi:hypothetical protein
LTGGDVHTNLLLNFKLNDRTGDHMAESAALPDAPGLAAHSEIARLAGLLVLAAPVSKLPRLLL